MAPTMKQLSTIFHSGHWRWWRSRPEAAPPARASHRAAGSRGW